MQMFCQFSSEQEHFSHDMYITALIRPSDVKIELIMCYEGMVSKISGAVAPRPSR